MYTKLNVRNASNLLRISPCDEWKSVFHTREALFESLLISFGLTNAPASFQTFINNTLTGFLDRYATAYPDDILIYSNILDEHRVHGKSVLEALLGAGVKLKPEKCEFEKEEVRY